MEEVTKIKQGENYFGLNHFILWCKNWYVLTPKLAEQYKDNEEKLLVETLKRVLYLDDYAYASNENNILEILLNNLERYNEWAIKNKKKHLSASNIIRKSNEYMNLYCLSHKVSYFESVVYAIRDFFAYDNLVELYAPIYSNKLYKMGLRISTWNNGETYKQVNERARRCKFEETEEYIKATNKRIKRYLEYK